MRANNALDCSSQRSCTLDLGINGGVGVCGEGSDPSINNCILLVVGHHDCIPLVDVLTDI